MKIFILWALLKTGIWMPMQTFEGLTSCNQVAVKYGQDKELMERASAILVVCLPPNVKPTKLHGA